MQHAERLIRLGRAERVAEQAWADEREARNRAIDQANRDGLSIRSIARWIDRSPQTVFRILAEMEARRQHAQRREER